MNARRAVAIGLGAAAAMLAAPTAFAQDGGAPVLPPVVGPEVNVSSSGYGSTPLGYGWDAACSDDRCMLSWNTYQSGYVMPIDSEGQPLRQAALILSGFVGRPGAAFLGDDFVVGAYAGTELTLIRLSKDGAVRSTTTLTVTSNIVSNLALAWNGSRLMILFREQIGSDSGNIYTMVVDANFATIAGPTLLAPSATTSYPPKLLVRTGNEFVVLTGTQSWALNGAGQIVLGPVPSPLQVDFAFEAISAGGAPVLLSNVPAALIRLGTDLRAASTASPLLMGSGVSTGLAWNGTHILLVEAVSSSSSVSMRRFNLDLGAADAVATTLPVPLNAQPFAAGRASEFMLFVTKTNYVTSEYGIYARPLNAGGRPRTTTETLVSVAALRHWRPFLVAQPAGYVAVAAQGETAVAVMPLGGDGQPVPARPPTSLATGRTPSPTAVGTSPAGGMAVVADFGINRMLASRFDGVGHVLDDPPLVSTGLTQYRGGMFWNGTSYFLLAGNATATVGADGSVGSFFNYFFPASPGLTALDGMGTTSLLAFIYARLDGSGFDLAAMRFDPTGMPVDANPVVLVPAPAGTVGGTGVSVGHDGTRYLAAMDPAVREANGALTSEMRVVRIGANAQAADTSSTLLRRATGAAPASGAQPVPAISNPTVVYDGRMYWVVWREQGLWVRRVATDARVLDGQPIKLLDEPFSEFALASQGNGALLLAYSRLDVAPDAQSVRLKARLITTGDTTGTGGAGGGGGAGGAGGGGSGRGGGGGTGGSAGRGGGGGSAGSGAAGATGGGGGGASGGSGAGGSAGRGGASGTGGTTGAAGAGGASGSAGASGAGGASGSAGAGGASGSAGTSGAGGATGASGSGGTSDAGVVTDAASGGSGGGAQDAAPDRTSADASTAAGSSGCGCATAGAPDARAALGLVVFAFVALAGWRSRPPRRRG